MNVLSLFDGMSCGQIALNRAGVKYDKYYASEINKSSIIVTQDNYPNTIQLGDVVKLKRYLDKKNISLLERMICCDFVKEDSKVLAMHCIDILTEGVDFLFGGSPCTGFSFAGKQLNFSDPQSKLFFDFIEIKNTLNPPYVFLENTKMRKEHQEVISEFMELTNVKIDSSKVSAQHRERLYWSNLKTGEIQDKGIVVKDILEKEVDDNYLIINNYNYVLKMDHSKEGFKKGELRLDLLAYLFNPVKHQRSNKPICMCQIVEDTPSLISRQTDRIYSYLGKSPCLTTFNSGIKISTSDNFEDTRELTRLECERLQTVPEGYTNSVSENKAKEMLGNGWTVDIIVEFFKNLPEKYFL